MHDEMLMEEKAEALEKLKEMMMKLILEGKGDEEASVEEALESNDEGSGVDEGDVDQKVAEADDEQGSMKDMVGSFLRKGKSLPTSGKGTAVMISMKGKGPGMSKKLGKKGV